MGKVVGSDPSIVEKAPQEIRDQSVNKQLAEKVVFRRFRIKIKSLFLAKLNHRLSENT